MSSPRARRLWGALSDPQHRAAAIAEIVAEVARAEGLPESFATLEQAVSMALQVARNAQPPFMRVRTWPLFSAPWYYSVQQASYAAWAELEDEPPHVRSATIPAIVRCYIPRGLRFSLDDTMVHLHGDE